MSRPTLRSPRRTRTLALVSPVAALLALVLAAAALGAGEGPKKGEEEERDYAPMGSECEATESSFASTVFQDEISGLTFYTRAPYNGVVTQWVVRIGYATKPIPLALSVINQIGESDQFEVKAQTAPSPADKGETLVKARLPIFKGEALALTSIGEGAMPICETNHPVLDNVWSAGRSMKTGESEKFFREGGFVPVEAQVERDQDRDGFGDATQDRCPRNAKRHARPCRKPAEPRRVGR